MKEFIGELLALVIIMTIFLALKQWFGFETTIIILLVCIGNKLGMK